MPKEDIIRGLEGAMSKGESLEKAMYSFYNAGYKKEDVEAAMHALSIHLSQQESLVPGNISQINLPKSSSVSVPAKTIVQSRGIGITNIKPKIEIRPQTEIKSVEMDTIIPKPSLMPMAAETQKEKQSFFAQQKPKVVAEVSSYKTREKTGIRTILIIFLSAIFVILLGSLV